MPKVQKEKRIVTTPSLFEIDESFQDERFMKIRVCAMHSGVNENHSRFSVETILEAKDTFKNIPILARAREYEDDDGNTFMDYSSHDMHIEEDFFNPGEDKLIYDEVCVGIVPETNNFELVYDQETDKFYVYVDALLYRDYGNYVCDILESRGGKTDVSMEIACEDISYEEGGILNVAKMVACGCTLLSAETLPGMKGANATVTFSSNDNKRQEQLLKIMQEIKFSLDNYIAMHTSEMDSVNSKKYARKEEAEMDNENKLEEPVIVLDNNAVDNTEEAGAVENIEIVVEENIQTAEVDFEEDAENAETFEDENAEETGLVEEVVIKENSMNEDGNENTDGNDEVEQQFDNVIDNTANSDQPETEAQTAEAITSRFVKTFELSHEDIRCGLYYLIDAAYPDECLDIIQVFEDRFIMSDWFATGFYWSQGYSHDDNGVTLVGDRVQVFAEFVTEAERDALNLMRNTYTSMEAELNKYKSAEVRAEKIAKVQNNEDYSAIRDTDEFKELLSKMDEYSLEDLSIKADLLLAKYAKSSKMFSFTNNAENTGSVGGEHIVNLVSSFEDNSKEKKPYGGIFEEYFKRKNRKH